MTTPLQELEEYVGPNGPDRRKPCPAEYHHLTTLGPLCCLAYETRALLPDCGGQGSVLDTEAPLFRALWTERQGIWSHRDCRGMGECQNLLADGSPVPGTTDCKGAGFVPRSCAEALMNLWDAALGLLAEDGYIVVAKDGVALVGWPGKPQQDDRIWIAGDWRDALPAAVLMWLKAQAENHSHSEGGARCL